MTLSELETSQENPHGYENHLNYRIKEIQSRFPELCFSFLDDGANNLTDAQSSGFTDTGNPNQQQGIVK